MIQAFLFSKPYLFTMQHKMRFLKCCCASPKTKNTGFILYDIALLCFSQELSATYFNSKTPFIYP